MPKDKPKHVYAKRETPAPKYVKDRYGVSSIHSGPNRKERRAYAASQRKDHYEFPDTGARKLVLTRRGTRSLSGKRHRIAVRDFLHKRNAESTAIVHSTQASDGLVTFTIRKGA